MQNKAIYVVLGVNLEGEKEVLGLWVAQQEGAKFWLQVLTELQNRGVKDIFIACVDGLKGFPEAIEAVYPRTEVQLCIVHLVRASLNYVPWKARKPVAADLQSIYRAATAAEAEQHLQELEGKWKAYPSVSQVWRRNWARITPFFNYPPDIRRAIYTTNSVESLNRSLRKIIKTRGGFPNEEAALKLLFLALRQAAKKWTMPIHHLAGSIEPLHDSVAGTDAGPGESFAMTTWNAIASMGRGSRLHKSLDTPLYIYSFSNHPSLRRNYDVREFASESSSDNQIILASQTLGLYCHAGVFLPVDIDLQCSPVVSGSRGKPSSQCQFC